MTDPSTYVSRRALLVAGLALPVLGLHGCADGGARVLRAADAQPSDYPTVEAVRYMAELLHARSEGRLSTKIYPGAVLGEEKDTLEITIFGGLDFNRVSLSPLNSIARETVVPSLPFMFRSIEHMRKAMDGVPGDAILRSLEPHGLIGLCFYESGARSFYTSKTPIHTPDDLIGQKIRVQNSDLFVSMVEALGGDATPMSFSEVYQGLVQGVVDGAENNWPSYESTRHYEAANYYTLTRHVMAPEVLVMSAHRWAKLSSTDRDLVRECARDSVPVMRDLWDARVEASRALVLANGNEVIEPDIMPFQDKVRSVWDRYLTSPDLKAIADDIQRIEV